MSEDVLSLADQGDPEAVLAWYRRQADASPYFFSKVIAGYGELTPDLHQPICSWLVDSEVERGRGLLFPRKYFKSSMVKGYVLRLVMQFPEERLLFVGENDDVAAKNIADIQWNIRNNKLLHAMYPDRIPPDLGRDWPTTALTLPRGRSYDEPTIQSVGIGAKHTGFHYTKIIYDDPIGLVASRSAMVMKQAIEWFKAANGLLDSDDSQELIIGTRWKHGAADLYGWIMEHLPARTVDGRKEGYKWYARGAIEEGRSIFPPQVSQRGKRIGYSLGALEAMRRRMGTYLFNANMMNNPTAGEDTDFADSSVKTYRITEDRRHVILNDHPTPIPISTLVRILVYDPSSGGSSADAENAIVVVGVDMSGRILVLDGWSKNCGFGRAIEQWHVLNDKWKCWRNFYEAVGAHKEVEEILKMRYETSSESCTFNHDGKPCGKRHTRIRPFKILPPSGSKEDRIRDLAQPAFEAGRVYIGEGMTKLRGQITEFPHGALVDMFDALAYAISKARKPKIRDDNHGGAKQQKQQNRPHEKRTHSVVDYGGYG